MNTVVEAAKKRGREMQFEAAGLGSEAMRELSTSCFDILGLASAIQDRQSLRVQLMKKDKEIESRLARLSKIPPARALVDTLEKEYRKALSEERKKEREAKEPKKKRSRRAEVVLTSSEEEEEEE